LEGSRSLTESREFKQPKEVKRNSGRNNVKPPLPQLHPPPHPSRQNVNLVNPSSLNPQIRTRRNPKLVSHLLLPSHPDHRHTHPSPHFSIRQITPIPRGSIFIAHLPLWKLPTQLCTCLSPPLHLLRLSSPTPHQTLPHLPQWSLHHSSPL
jgi:hypothetical protein